MQRDPRITEAAIQALRELGLTEQYDVTRASTDDDGQWCARLEPKDPTNQGTSVCIPAGGSDLARNAGFFKNAISSRLGLTGFSVPCPNGHTAHHTYDREELRKEIENGTLMYFCYTCNERWLPAAEDLANLLRRLDDGV